MEFYEIRRAYKKFENKVPCMLYQPVLADEKSKVAVILEHSDDDYFDFVPAKELAKRGYSCFVSNVTDPKESLDQKIEELSCVVEYAKNYPGIEKVILLGHSGGATLMSAYQSIAENGPDIFRDDKKIIKLDDMGEKRPADGVMLLDANFGNGVMSLLSLDPSIVDETDGMRRNPKLDLFNPENGYDEKGCHFSAEFLNEYKKGQAERMNRLIDYARERVFQIERGKGKFVDDEPMFIPGGTQYAPCNKIINQMTDFFSHTEGKWDLIGKNGEITNQTVNSVRIMRPGILTAERCHFGALTTTVKCFLKSSAVRALDDFGYDESTLKGVDWESSYCCTTGNVAYISRPMLIMGMTGSYEYIAAEHIYKRAVKSLDKTLAFVKGASHNFVPAFESESEPGEFGDTVKNCFDFVDRWIYERYIDR
ncbi:MAG: alpha/beta hydrolase [Lachnospiraceae bacterium]|nr:alpha/beta hydrolase [Lachnospiraceae bacterium]